MIKEKDGHLLTRASEKISFLYIDKARIEQTNYSVQIILEQNKWKFPLQNLTV